MLSTSVGVGIVLPHPEGEEGPEGFQAILEEYLSSAGEEDLDYGDMYEELLEKYPLLTLEFGGVSEYYSDYTVMVKSSLTNIWDGSGSIDPAKFSISNEEFDQLSALIMALGFEKINPEIVVAASYG